MHDMNTYEGWRAWYDSEPRDPPQPDFAMVEHLFGRVAEHEEDLRRAQQAADDAGAAAWYAREALWEEINCIRRR
jgi:hypothetical protein